MLVNLIKLVTHEIETSYAIDEFANCQNEDEDIDINTIHTGYLNGLIPVSQLHKLFKRIKNDSDATHIDISYDDDDTCRITEFKLEIANKESAELFHREKNEEKARLARINELEAELRKLKDKQFIDDNLPF
jgi:hypothetical protein